MKKYIPRLALMFSLFLIVTQLVGCGGKNTTIQFAFKGFVGKSMITSATLGRGSDATLPEDLPDDQDMLSVVISLKDIETGLLNMKEEDFDELKAGVSIQYQGSAYLLKNMYMGYTAGKGVESLTFAFYVPLDAKIPDCTLRVNDTAGEKDYLLPKA